jgi:peroxiredoxin
MDLKQTTPVGRAGWLTVGASLLVGLIFGLKVFRSEAQAAADASRTSTPAAVVDSLAPEFSLKTVEGETVQLSDLRGQVVALNFWATWCAPCRLEMPALQARADARPDRLAVIGVNFDESADAVAAFRDELGIRFPLLLDPGGEVQRLYRVLGYPTTFFLDETGTIRFQHVGLMSEDQLDSYLKRLGVTS